jgi:PAS domain S-box-containing protein
VSHRKPEVNPQILEQSTEELYEHGPCGYLALLPNGEIVKANHTFLSWTGYHLDDVMGKTLQSLLTVPGKIYYDTHYRPLLTMQGFVNELALDLVHDNGSTLPILLNSTLKRDAAGEPRLVLAAVFDATERRAYERELLKARKEAERASRIKADLLSMVSHDIRTPVSAIVTGLQLLEHIESTPQQQKPLRIMKSASQTLLNLLNDVLDFSKIEAGRVELDERPFDIRRSLETHIMTLSPGAEEKKLRLTLEVDNTVPSRVVGDEVKIGQVIGNLLTNAIKFTEEGQVDLRVTRKKAYSDRVWLEFAVSDTGIGIAKDRIPYIFDEFTQASEDTSRKFGGTGLGLAICKKLVGLYQSDISVESEPGRGSRFSFELQLGTPDASAAVSDGFQSKL